MISLGCKKLVISSWSYVSVLNDGCISGGKCEILCYKWNDVKAEIVAIYNKTKYRLKKVVAVETGNLAVLSDDAKITVTDNNRDVVIDDVGGRPLLGSVGN